MKKAFFLLFPFCLSVNAQTVDDCSTVNVFDKYSDASPHSLEMKSFFSHSRNQSNFGACYGFSAADLISFEVNTPISALDLTFKNEMNSEGSNHIFGTGGSATSAIELAFPTACSEGELPVNTKLTEPATTLVGDTLGQISQLIDFSNKNPSTELIDQILKVNFSWFPNLTSVDISAVLQKNSKLSLPKFLTTLAALNCKHPVQIPKFHIEDSRKRYSANTEIVVFDDGGGESAKYAMEVLEEGLAKGKIVEIGYSPPKMFGRSGEDGSHSSTITGRFKYNGKCMYVIRNSWGNAPCGRKPPENKDIICGSKEGVELPIGSMAVPRDALFSALSDSSYISDSL